MIAELGHFSLIIALLMALVQGVLPLAGAHTGRSAWTALARPAARGQFLFVLLAYACLTQVFIANDFSVLLAATGFWQKTSNLSACKELLSVQL